MNTECLTSTDNVPFPRSQREQGRVGQPRVNISDWHCVSSELKDPTSWSSQGPHAGLGTGRDPFPRGQPERVPALSGPLPSSMPYLQEWTWTAAGPLGLGPSRGPSGTETSTWALQPHL